MDTFSLPLAVRVLVGIAGLAMCSVAGAAPNTAVIHGASLGRILNWQDDGTSAIYIEAAGNKWYRATFWAPCYTLPFSETIAFVTEPNGDLDAYSSILAGGDRCWFKEFAPTTEPSSRDGRRAYD